MMTVNQIQADIRKMERFIGERIPPDDLTRIVLADCWNGPVWVDLFSTWDDEGECDLIIKANEPDVVRLRDVYQHFRRTETTCWERERETAAERNRWKVWDLERVMAELSRKPDRRSSPDAEESNLDGEELPREVSTAEAARILGVSKDTVLKWKSAGLLEYRNLSPPTSSRGVFRFLLASVMELRKGYQTDFPAPPTPQPLRRRVRRGQQPQFKHLRLE